MLRPVGIHDVRFLRDMLRHAYHWRIAEDEERPVYRYVQNWGRRGDVGVSDGGYGTDALGTANFFEALYPWPERITAVSTQYLTVFQQAFPEVTAVRADGRREQRWRRPG